VAAERAPMTPAEYRHGGAAIRALLGMDIHVSIDMTSTSGLDFLSQRAAGRSLRQDRFSEITAEV
jgi:hypothetical protein